MKQKEHTNAALRKQLLDCRKKLKALKEEANKNLEGWQRCSAAFENLKKEKEEEFARFKKFANRELILKMLDILDSLDLAVKHIPSQERKLSWVQGILNIRKMWLTLLKSEGVEAIEAKNTEFNPNLHEAVEVAKGGKTGRVLEEIRKGYLLRGELLRPARVRVCK